jgi:hypothetical protein
MSYLFFNQLNQQLKKHGHTDSVGPLSTAKTLYRKFEDSKQIFPEMKLRGLVPNSYFHVCVIDLYIPTIGPPILWEYTMST